MKLSGCPRDSVRYNIDWQVQIWDAERYGAYITDISEDGTFTTDVPEGMKLIASPKYPGPFPVGSDWTPAKDGGELIIRGGGCDGLG